MKEYNNLYEKNKALEELSLIFKEARDEIESSLNQDGKVIMNEAKCNTSLQILIDSFNQKIRDEKGDD